MSSYSNFQRDDKKYQNFNIFDDSKDASKKVTSVRNFNETKADWRKYCEYWKSYPDKFIDFIRDETCPIKLHFYQRMFLRILFRYRKVYLTFTRGTAKSWTQILAMYLRCMFYPGTELFICAPGKEQAAKITKENVEKIWEFFPILRNEVKHVSFQKDYTRLIFQNGSKFDVVQVSDASRGGRRHGGAVEEIADEKMTDKKDLLHSAVIPMMANDRLSRYQPKDDSTRIDPYEKHKSQWYVTTAGIRQSFAFEKLVEVMGEMAQGKDAFVLGAGFELPCMHEQLDIDFINELKDQPTYNPLSFAREYESIWTGTSEDSLVSLEDLNKCRILTKAEDKAVPDKDVMYVLAYDVARSEGSMNASCALAVIKISPKPDGTYHKHIVNVYSFEGTHFKDQALFLKRKVNDFRASMLVIDSNGLGKGLVDYLVTEIDENPPYEVVNDDRYDKYKTDNSIKMIFSISSQTKETNASDINNVFMRYVNNHNVKFLYSESQARGERKGSKDKEKEARELLPYIMTDRFIDEVLNLEYKQEGNRTKVKQISRTINKDKFSAISYGLFYIYTLEMKNQLRQKTVLDASKFMAFKKPKHRPY